MLASPLALAGSLPFAESGAFTFDSYKEVTDTDSDGMPDAWETPNGLNCLINDAAGNPDGDPFSNIQEYNAGTNPQVADNASESDGLSSQFTYNGVDLVPDGDRDGLPDWWETQYGLNGSVPNANEDPDHDGLSNLEEFNGGWNPIVFDNATQLWAESTLSLTDTGAYPLGFSTDSEGDGMPDWWEVRYGLNPSINDSAGNPDGDELTNLQEYQAGRIPNVHDQFGEGFDASGEFVADTIGRQLDTDGDLMPDVWESANGLNPLINDANADPDHDGWTNLQEYNAGTNPQVDEWAGPDRLASGSMLLDTGAYPLGFTHDTDSDGMPDWWEEKYGLLRLINDGTANPDGDSYSNVEEYRRGLHPKRSDYIFVINGEGGFFLLDTGGEFFDGDSDGMPNWWERKYAGNPTAMTAFGDLDHDGQNNLDEYVAGLDPSDPSSVFKIDFMTVEPAPNGKMTIKWASLPGRTYHLHVGTTLSDLSDPALFSVIGNGSTITRQIDKNGRKSMFCRISVELSE